MDGENGRQGQSIRSGKDSWLEGRTGGVYVPPHKREESSGLGLTEEEKRQRLAWEKLKKGINGVVNKANASNLAEVVVLAFRCNLIRGMGLFCRAIVKAQMVSPEFTPVYAALVAIVNSKFPEVGELLLARIIAHFRKGYRRSDKGTVLSTTKFLAHLVNQRVAHEVVALELVTLLLERPTDDSVEVAVAFLRECGSFLTETAPRGIHAIFERFRSILHEGEGIQKRVQYVVEGLFGLRRRQFEGHPPVEESLDLVEEEDMITHEISLDDETDLRTELDVFRFDEKYEENEEMYASLRKEILGDDEDGEGGEGEEVSGENGSPDESEDEALDEDVKEVAPGGTIDLNQTDLIGFRRTIYLTIMSSLSFEEGSHKLMKLMKENPNREKELCAMIVECCSQERSYLKYYGLLGQRFCLLNRAYVVEFEGQFAELYATVHRFETNKIRNVARFFAELMQTDSMPWNILQLVVINEEETTSSSRIFLKVLFQELAQYLTVESLQKRLLDPKMASIFGGLFPKDSLNNTRFSINFFTSIGLGALTDDMREYLRVAPRPAPKAPSGGEETSGSESSSLSSSSLGSSEDLDVEPKVRDNSAVGANLSDLKARQGLDTPEDASSKAHVPDGVRPSLARGSATQRSPRRSDGLQDARSHGSRPRDERRPPAGRGRALTRPAWAREEDSVRQRGRMPEQQDSRREGSLYRRPDDRDISGGEQERMRSRSPVRKRSRSRSDDSSPSPQRRRRRSYSSDDSSRRRRSLRRRRARSLSSDESRSPPRRWRTRGESLSPD